MSAKDKMEKRILSDKPPKDVELDDLISVAEHNGFTIRENGAALIFRHPKLGIQGTKTLHKPHGNKKYVDPAGVREIRNAIFEIKRKKEEEEKNGSK